MPKAPTDPDYLPFEFRPGSNGFPDWGGVRRDGDPSFGPPNTLRLMLNALGRNGEIKSRGGQTPFNSALLVGAVTGNIKYFVDYQLARPIRLWMLSDGCPGLSPTAGFSINTYDEEQSPLFQSNVYYDSASTNGCMGIFDGRLWSGVDNVLRQVVLIRPNYGEGALAVSGAQGGPSVITLTSGTIGFIQEFDSKMFIGNAVGAGTSRIVSYTGVAQRDDLTAINAPTGAGLYRDWLVVGFGAATNGIRLRERGLTGTWTTVANGAGTTAMTQCGGVSYKDNFYWGDGTNIVWKYDGTSITAARTIVGATTLRSVVVFNNLLYYGYTSSGGAGLIGKFDGSTWTDAEKNLTSQFSANTGVRTIFPCRGDLFATGPGTGAGAQLYRSPGTTTSGTWVPIDLSPNTTVVDVLQMLVY